MDKKETIPAPTEPPPMAQIIITLNHKGEVFVNGPLNNLMLMHGMLETAKDVARTKAAEMANRVQPATPGEVALIKQ